MSLPSPVLQADQSSPSLDFAPLGDVLHLLRLTGTFYCNPELSAPWAIDVPDMGGQMVLLVVTEGSCLLQTEHCETISLTAGQLVLLPHGKPVVMSSDAEAVATPLFDIPAIRHSSSYETMIFGGGGAITRMTCGVLKLDHAAAERLQQLLPPVIRLDTFAQHAGPWIYSTLKYLAEEACNPQPGGETVLTRLTDILVVQAIRAWLQSNEALETGWLAALRDPKIGRALQAFHRAPQEGWTIARLAERAGMSRSAFAARFKQLTGEGVMQYALHWRMQLAQMDLKEGKRTLAEIAIGLGYESEAAFARAFKRIVGTSPGAYRRQ